jgi:outer membrane murein-binding lipoprotein Lpp
MLTTERPAVTERVTFTDNLVPESAFKVERAAREKFEAETKRAFEKIDVRFDKIDVRFDKVESRVESVRAELNARIDKVESGLNARIDKVESGLNAKIDKVESGLNAKIDKVDVKIEGVRQDVQSGFRWMITTQIAFTLLILGVIYNVFMK